VRHVGLFSPGGFCCYLAVHGAQKTLWNLRWPGLEATGAGFDKWV